mgnify:CR=1 FL=1
MINVISRTDTIHKQQNEIVIKNNIKKNIEKHKIDIKSLYSEYNLDDIVNMIYNNNHTYIFIMTCIYGNLEIAKLLLNINPNININYKEQAFIKSCQYGHLHVVKWLLETNPDIDISGDNYLAFRWSCFNGHLNIIKLLYEMKPDMNNDITICNKDLFRLICENDYIEIIQFLYKLNPKIVINNVDTLSSYYNNYNTCALWLRHIIPLSNQFIEFNEQINTLNTKINTLNTEINTLNTEINTIKNKT